MAATSSSLPSRASRNKLRDRLWPQFPIDPSRSSTTRRPSGPSTSSSGLNEPWLLDSGRVPLSKACKRDVVLVLGIPSERSVSALLASHSFIHSLVIFASHCPPARSLNPVPSVRALRLASPLAVEDAGATRLISTLEWAEQVARIWRASGSESADFVCYDEATKGASLPGSGSSSRSFSQRRRLNSLSGRHSTGSLPPADPSQRPFDAILNYISHHDTEKHVLKQTILVTSITTPFLAPTFSPYHKLSGAKETTRRRLTRRTHSLPPTPPCQSGDLLASATSSVMTTRSSAFDVNPINSHMIHIVPPTARIGLIRSLDLFLSSFSRRAFGSEEVSHAKQYVLSSSTMHEPVVHPRFDQGQCTVLDLVLSGGLDFFSERSWIGAGRDIIFIPTPRQSVSHPLTHVKPSSHFSSFAEPSQTERRIAKHSRLVPGGGECALQNRQLHLDPTSPQGPYRQLSLDASFGRAQRSGPAKPNRPIDISSGLLTPPDSDEDVGYLSTPPHPPVVSKLPTPQSKKPQKWMFWK
ncbi:hypothetical protein BJ322DRAFT_1105932 [Thelephora terrestris]|uniref:Uncharacterized protein n=1 Tax=Thelephora terrestris TaxID=56493 RepID=A0A9P6HI55_9AGAM|nr:hypothetical protein BJ322DRAFT_1105932 [Thelephora terrestris]